MTLPMIGVVLCAAALHASWNALLKSGGDRFASVVIMAVTAGLLTIPALLILPLPQKGAWGCAVLSMALHVGYNLVLVRAYRHGDLGQVYPVARGSSPLLVMAGALAVAGEQPGALTIVGVLLVSGGILSLARGWTGEARAGLPAALATGAFIATYTVTDGLGGRLAGDPLSYAAWLFALDGLAMGLVFGLRRGFPAMRPSVWGRAAARSMGKSVSKSVSKSAAGGAVSLLAYTGVIWAASRAPMGPVSALRETSVVFAALIGRFCLGEHLSWRRFASCLLVAGGAVLLGIAA